MRWVLIAVMMMVILAGCSGGDAEHTQRAPTATTVATATVRGGAPTAQHRPPQTGATPTVAALPFERSPAPLPAAVVAGTLTRLLREAVERTQHVADLVQTPPNNRADWRMEARTAIEAAQRTLALLRQFPSPPCLDAVHAELMTFVDAEEEALRAALQAVTGGDAASLTSAVRRSHEATASLDRTTALLGDVPC